MTQWGTQVRFFHFSFFVVLFCVKKTKHISTISLSQMILMQCARPEETAHAVSISHHLPLTSRGWGTTWLKNRRSSSSYGRFLVGEPLWYKHKKQCDTFWEGDVRCLFVMQPTWDLCGCCSWWRTVRGTPTLTFWPNTFDRASAKGSQTVWVSRMCSTGQTQLYWATCSESTQVSVLLQLTVTHDCFAWSMNNICKFVFYLFITKWKTHVNHSAVVIW